MKYISNLPVGETNYNGLLEWEESVLMGKTRDASLIEA